VLWWLLGCPKSDPAALDVAVAPLRADPAPSERISDRVEVVAPVQQPVLQPGCAYALGPELDAPLVLVGDEVQALVHLDGQELYLDRVRGRPPDLEGVAGDRWTEVYEGRGYRVELRVAVVKDCGEIGGDPLCEATRREATLVALRPDGTRAALRTWGGCES
jgi:hypothetical protein